MISAFDSHFDGNVNNVFNWVSKVNGYEQILRVSAPSWSPRPPSDLTVTFGCSTTTHSTDTVPDRRVRRHQPDRLSDRDHAPPNAGRSRPCWPPKGVTPSADNTTISADQRSTAEDRNAGVSAQIDWQFGGGYTLTSITAYRTWNNVQRQDYDQTSQASTAFPQVLDTGHLQFAQTSEELRIASPKGQFIDYVAGLYYLDAVDHEIYERDDIQISAGAPVVNSGINHLRLPSDQNYAVFGEANVNFTQRSFRGDHRRAGWSGTISCPTTTTGSRPRPVAITGIAPSLFRIQRVHQSKHGYARRAWACSTTSAPATSTSLRHLSRAAIRARPTTSSSTRATTANEPRRCNPETSNSYEAGVKGQFFDHQAAGRPVGRSVATNFNNYQANSTQILGWRHAGDQPGQRRLGPHPGRGGRSHRPADQQPDPRRLLDMLYDDAKVVNFPCPAGAAITCNINGQPLPFAPKEKVHLEGDYQVSRSPTAATSTSRPTTIGSRPPSTNWPRPADAIQGAPTASGTPPGRP